MNVNLHLAIVNLFRNMILNQVLILEKKMLIKELKYNMEKALFQEKLHLINYALENLQINYYVRMAFNS